MCNSYTTVPNLKEKKCWTSYIWWCLSSAKLQSPNLRKDIIKPVGNINGKNPPEWLHKLINKHAQCMQKQSIKNFKKPERKGKEPYHFKKYLVRNQKVNKQKCRKTTYHISLSINLGLSVNTETLQLSWKLECTNTYIQFVKETQMNSKSTRQQRQGEGEAHVQSRSSSLHANKQKLRN